MNSIPRTNRSSHKGEAGFTLLEILVVLTCAGLLAGLLLPALQTARSKANAVACLQHEQQIGQAMLLYANDNNLLLPPASLSGLAWPANSWYYYLKPYLGLSNDSLLNMPNSFGGVFRCPGKADWSLHGALQQVSYAMNTFSTSGTGPQMRLPAIAQPSRTALVSDVQDGSSVLPNSDYLYKAYTCQRHRGCDNVLFCDGHTQAVPFKGLAYGLTLP